MLSTLVGDERVGDAARRSRSIPTIRSAALDFPLIAVEVAYVSGVTGNNLFVLSPEQASKLAAVMMGLTSRWATALSEIELSAVSEAMNQMMGAATNVMADTLTMDIEVAPPTCTVISPSTRPAPRSATAPTARASS